MEARQSWGGLRGSQVDGNSTTGMAPAGMKIKDI